MAVEQKRVQSLRGSVADWGANDIVPLVGELCIAFDGGRARLKSGDGVNAFSVLPWIGERDDVARQEAALAQGAAVTLEARITNVETAASNIGPMQQAISANAQALAGKQAELAPGAATGDLLYWNGSAWVTLDLGATPDALLRYDGAAGRWITIPRGPAGYIMTVSPTGVPQWLPSGSVTVRSLTLAGQGPIEAAFNAAAPTIASGEMVLCTFGGDAFIYTGPPGSGITNAVAGNFTRIGAASSYATLADFAAPVGGATAMAVSPAVAIEWIKNVNFDAGQIP